MRAGDNPQASFEDRVLDVLSDVPDPEIPVISVVDLGIVRSVECMPPTVLLTPTYSGCPATLVIEQAVRTALDGAGFHDVGIRTVLSPPWTTDWISDAGREKLRAYGIAPPPRGAAMSSLRNKEAAACPRCGSTETHEVSRFGSTPCKALWQCESCLEPFDRFKCH
ncbi:phenylacetate-CoA oxygenase subunit PaaJ [Altererythrobacter sp. B11]|uniref:1,2-phenylacetyl-CoA epoxidase subunit PaaD n=1 Tax=Altererythrobacter sp. B11 TaxID=2060312 RepID=UPI000DC6F4CE|nr:1,2-phenylacetyl-CoA epoxidase subunit PaaD [Altererythrobacter sp. B11]BBC73289.1 phenylacetate-CoA oxygenase subunit PaaJ [Altererythrobacter sp. B11]